MSEYPVWSFGDPVPARGRGYEREMYAPRNVRPQKGRDCLKIKSAHFMLTQEKYRKQPNPDEVSHTASLSLRRY